MNDFFKKINVFVLTSIKLFNFITDITLTEGCTDQASSDAKIELILNGLLQEAQAGYSEE